MTSLMSVMSWIVLVSAFVSIVTVEGRLIAISNLPEMGQHHDNLYIYAIFRDALDESGEFEIGKDGGLPSNIVRTGTLPIRSVFIGCYLQVNEPGRQKGSRYGRYTAEFIFDDRDTYPIPLMAETFVKPPTKLLDTGGVYTVTIYPAGADTTTLAKPVSIGVRQSPGCRSISWCKGKKLDINTGPRLRLTDTNQAGLYTISRPRRGKRGWSVQIRVIAASCPEGQYLSPPSGPCTPGREYKNGGVLADKENSCICPLFYTGPDCGCVFPDSGCPGGWAYFNGFCYLYVDTRMHFQDHVDACRVRGSQLISIHSAEEEVFAIELANRERIYIGLNDRDEEGTFVWTDGTEFDFSNWFLGQPNHDPDEHCVTIVDNKWYDRPCNMDFPSLCKRPAESYVVEPLTNLRCRDLPGGNPKCKGHLACNGDNYGCKCVPGWWGNACNIPCPKGKYGPGCEQRCPEEERGCNRFFGPSSNWKTGCIP